ncbi:MBOAT family O-acyltransferase [Bradyrhizobium ottawaense]|uniref:MBOAT family O-acyltransferase n=1 Tax=Bradyrhizobium ottawaense TaxID=931866 RepID=UPI003834AE4B
MLFNSFSYLAVFLPAAWLIYLGTCKWLPRCRLVVLLAISIAFYGYWDQHFILLIVLSVLLNWLTARWFASAGRQWIIYGAIAANIIVLGVFKYLNFLLGLLPFEWGTLHFDIALPLGISFFTFHHVMYLTDLRRKLAPQYSLVEYGLYISFFPQVLAGPLVRWREVMHQFAASPFPSSSLVGDSEQWQRAAYGLTLIILGLCQKVMLGDHLATVANPVFAQAALSPVRPVDAWLGTLAFTFQIFFDFSGYTDMAIGSALLFGITLPQNFNAPYRATSLQDFWRRSRLVVPALICGPLTLLFVVFGWVLFRAQNFEAARHIYEALLWLRRGGTDAHLDLRFSAMIVGLAGLLAFVLPNTSTLVSRLPPRPVCAAGLGLLAACAILALNSAESFEFIYFRF